MIHSLERESKDPEQFKGSLKTCLLFAVFGGFILYLLSYFLGLVLPAGIIRVLSEDICYLFRLNPYNPWPGIFLCMIICMGIGLLFRGRVRVYDDEIRVYGLGKTTRILLKDFHHIEVKKIQLHLYFIPVGFWKCYLYCREGTSLKRHRLHGFNNRIANELNNRIRINDIKHMDIETKIKAADSVNNGFSGEQFSLGTEFILDHDRMFAKEAFLLRRTLFIYAVAAAICILIFLLDHTLSDTRALELGIVAAAFIIDSPVRIVSFCRRKAMCPSSIRISSAGLHIDNEYFPYGRIDKITLTRERKAAILPMQHFLMIQAGGRKKYWLGSDSSYPEYSSFCSTLQKAMVFSPNKLEYFFF